MPRDPRRPPLEEWQPDEAELLRGLFLDEAEVHLRHVAQAQATLARAAEGETTAPPDVIDGLFRHLHTLKGAAGSVGFEAIARAAHELEDLCAEMRAGRLAPTPGILERVEEGVAGLHALLEGARATPARPAAVAVPARPVERRRGADRRTGFDRRASERVVRADIDRLDALLEGVGDLVILRTRIDKRLFELEGVLRDLRATRGNLRSALSAAGQPQDGAGHAALLDRLGEVEVEFTDAISYLERATAALGTETESLRRTGDHLDEQLRRARQVPLEYVFGRLASALRELERAGNRPADLVARGAEIELDRSVIEQLSDPLLHLLRNSIAHGIEPPEERARLGKPARGRIEISAWQEDEFVYLRFADDGAGIDRELVRRALVRAGRLTEHAPLSDALMLATIFEPGFSSRAQADALAGRGMGLDIVRRAVVRLGGDVSVEYEPGQFTRFKLAVPLHAAITQALLFKAGGQVYAVPAAHVVEALPLGAEEAPATLQRAEGAAGLPVLRLQSLLGVEVPPGRHAAALHIRYGERSFVVTCDKVVGPRTIVVRPLGPLLAEIPLYAGVTVSGAGKAQLVLDLGALADAAHTPARPGLPLARRTQRRVLVVDDSRLSREAAARALAAAGYHPVTAEDGWEAWELLGERRFDAVVTDLEMPRLDGFELIARIRREPTLRGLPVVVLSSRTSQATRDRALEAGASAVLPKVPSKRGLGEALAAILGEEGPRRPRAGHDA